MRRAKAVEYARRGWLVFPCAGKIPLTPNGYKDAQRDPAAVDVLFSKHKDCNIGLVTGKASGFFVVDVDVKNGSGGDISLRQLEETHGRIPTTVESLTWSRGRHIFLAYPEHGIGCKVGIRPGIDIRGDGGYVIAPPSVIDGASYIWEASGHPDEVEIAEAPAWLLDLLHEHKPSIDLSKDTDKITKTKRNATLARVAGSMRRAGMMTEEIEIILQRINGERCDPPLPRREVEAIAKSIGRYAAGASNKDKEDAKFNCNDVAKSILADQTLIYCGDNFYLYNGSVYKQIDENSVKKFVADKIKDEFNIHRCNEVVHSIKVKVALNNIEELNHSEFLNIHNGMFNVNTRELTKHSPLDYSTIQLPVDYDPKAACPLWLKTLNEIFPDGKEKISLLQEYFGLCLTKSVKYEKAMFLLGEGRNGKSTVISVLQYILGKENYSAVTLEALVKPNYCAEIFGKLVNISEETSAKTSICDSTFKSIISGNAMLSDRKYGHPFMFFPFCKMIYALNNMPQVSDKTDAYFKRVIIINFTRKFEEVEQDRQLKDKLRVEASGIFLWMLEGLQRLEARGYFDIPSDVATSIDEYRKENNNVLVFVEEECCVGAEYSVSKKTLYEKYFKWCKDAGMYPLSKKKFGLQLVKHYGFEKDEFSDTYKTNRIWSGIDLNENFSFTNEKSINSEIN